MKQTLVPALQLSLKTSFHHNKAKALQILSYTNEELRVYLQEQGYQRISTSQDPMALADSYLCYEHQTTSLYDEVMNQIQLSNYQVNLAICEYLLLQLDGNGYFKTNYKTLIKQSPYTEEQIKHHLKVLRSFEPLGMFAFSLKQCLQIQCRYAMEPASETAYLLCSYLQELANHQEQEIMSQCQLTKEEFDEGYQFLKTLQPKPAASYQQATPTLTPEFKITVLNHQIQIQSLHDEFEFAMTEDQGETHLAMSDYIKKQRQEFLSLMDSVKKRNVTLLQIMQIICDVQKDFFIHGESLHSLQMTDIAQACGLHISTISRALMNKSFEFQQRYYAMSDMLIHGGNDQYSPNEIKKELLSLIEGEDKQAPFSDEKLRQCLEEKGITISRRAITKYREHCQIPNSNQRKKIQRNGTTLH